MNPQNRIQELVQEKAAGRRPDLVSLVEQLFEVAAETGGLSCTQVCNQGLRFSLPGYPPVEVKLDLAKSKLRMMCARLGVISREQSGKDVSLYGDEAEFDYDQPPGSARHWKVRFINTMHAQEFTIELEH